MMGQPTQRLMYYAVTKLSPLAPERVSQRKRTFQAFSADGAALQYARELGAKNVDKLLPLGRSKLTGAYMVRGGNLRPGIYHFGVVRFKVSDSPVSVDKRALEMRKKAERERGVVDEWEQIHPPGEPPTFVNVESQEYRKYREEVGMNPTGRIRRNRSKAKRNPKIHSKSKRNPGRLKTLNKITRV